VRSVCWYTDQEILKRYLGAALRRADLRNFGVIKFLWKRVSEAPVGQGGLIGAPLAATSSVSLPYNSPAQSDRVGTLALPHKSRSGSLALISKASEWGTGNGLEAGAPL